MKERFKFVKKLKFMAALVVVAVFFGILPAKRFRLMAETNTKQQIEQAENERENLKNQLDQNNENLEGLEQTQQTLQGELTNLNTQLENVSNNLSSLENSIQEKEEDIIATQDALDEAKAIETWQLDSMIQRIRAMYEMNDKNSLTDAIFGAGTFSQMVSAADYYEMIEAYDQRKLEEFKENRKLIEEQEARLQSDYAQLQDLRAAAQEEKNKISQLISNTSSSISHNAGQISEAEKRAREYEAEIKKKEEDITYLKKKLAEEMAMSRQAANATWRDISEVEFDEGDRYLLANLIYCEAGGEPYDGQVAVGSVVINRVLSSVYPDTVVGVIYQSGQFSPVASGRLALALSENWATDACYRAADEAMSGVTNVGNCVYFRTPIEGLQGISIGGHIFY